MDKLREELERIQVSNRLFGVGILKPVLKVIF
jgi:hypothetical protein